MLQTIKNIILFIPRKIERHFEYIHELEKENTELNIKFTKACRCILDMSVKAIDGEEKNPYMKCVPQFREIREIGRDAYLELKIREVLGFNEYTEEYEDNEDIYDDEEPSLYDFMNENKKELAHMFPDMTH